MTGFQLLILILIASVGLAGCNPLPLCANSPSPTISATTSTDLAEWAPFATPSITPSQYPTINSSPTPTATTSPSPQTPTPPACTAKNGEITQYQMDSDLLSSPLEYQVYTPPCYHDQADQRFPVLYLLHGYGYTYDQWVRLGAIEITDRLIRGGEIPPLIIVMPLESNQRGQPPKNPFGEALVNELVDMIDADFRTIPHRQFRAIGGLSRGGNWAFHLGLTHWQLFGIIGGHSSPLFILDTPAKIEAWLDEIPPDQLPIFFIDTGEDDKWFDTILHFASILDKRHIPHVIHIFLGTHVEEYWATHIEQYIRWYAANW